MDVGGVACKWGATSLFLAKDLRVSDCLWTEEALKLRWVSGVDVRKSGVELGTRLGLLVVISKLLLLLLVIISWPRFELQGTQSSKISKRESMNRLLVCFSELQSDQSRAPRPAENSRRISSGITIAVRIPAILLSLVIEPRSGKCQFWLLSPVSKVLTTLTVSLFTPSLGLRSLKEHQSIAKPACRKYLSTLIRL